MIIISQNLVLSPGVFDSKNPVVGWHNLVTINNITASSEAENYPITNVANPITAPSSRWRAADATGDEQILINLNSVEEVDYVGIARHNLGSEQISVMIEGSEDGGSPFTELVEESLLPDDGPAIFRFDPQALVDLRINLANGGGAPEIAVIYVGKLLQLQRRIYVGHTPMKYGRSNNIVNGRSESGDFLGRIVTSEKTSTSVNLQNMTPGWYRSDMDPFIEASKDTPFFFAWRPEDYPNEVGFAWMTNEPQPVNQRANGMMSIELQMTGIAP